MLINLQTCLKNVNKTIYKITSEKRTRNAIETESMK